MWYSSIVNHIMEQKQCNNLTASFFELNVKPEVPIDEQSNKRNKYIHMYNTYVSVNDLKHLNVISCYDLC